MSAKSVAIPDARYAKTIHGPVTFAVRPNQPWQIHFFIKSSLVSARLFMHKVREGMKSSGASPMDGNVQVDELVVGGKEAGKPGRSYDSKKKKVVCAVQLTDEGKVRRFYSLKIKDFSSDSLVGIFDKHISAGAKITTDEWRGYGPISKEYQLKQIPSNNGLNFKALHTMIHQVKSGSGPPIHR